MGSPREMLEWIEERKDAEGNVPEVLRDMKERYEHEITMEKNGDRLGDEFIDLCPKHDHPQVPEGLKGKLNSIDASTILGVFLSKIKEEDIDLKGFIEHTLGWGIEKFLADQIVNHFGVFDELHNELKRIGAVREKKSYEVIPGKLETWIEVSDVYDVIVICPVNRCVDDNLFIFGKKRKDIEGAAAAVPDFIIRTAWPKQKGKYLTPEEYTITHPSLDTYRKYGWTLRDINVLAENAGHVTHLEDIRTNPKADRGLINLPDIKVMLSDLNFVYNEILRPNENG